MSRKLTQAEVEQRLKERGWELVGKYINNHTKIEAKCPYCKKNKLIFPQYIFRNLIKSCGCVSKVCFSKNKELIQLEIENRFKENGWILTDKYINSDTEVQIICPYCNKNKLIKPCNILYKKSQSCGCMRYKLVSNKLSKAIVEKSLGFLYPEIVKLYSKNNEKSVFEIYPNSGHKFLWICEKYYHEYESRPSDIISGCRCSYCSGRKVLRGFNDFESQRPDLLIDWDYEKNTIKPNEVTCGSHKKIWWKCKKCNYQWLTAMNNRTFGKNCPNCCPVSYGVEKIKEFLENKNIKFEIEKRFQTCKNKRLLPFDFYLPDYNLLIEFNGRQHYKVEINGKFGGEKTFKQRQKHDKIKIEWSKNNNIKLLVIPYLEQNKIEDILCKELGIIQCFA